MNGNFKNLFSALAAPRTGRWHRPSLLPKEFLNVWQEQTQGPGALQPSQCLKSGSPCVTAALVAPPSPGAVPSQPRWDTSPDLPWHWAHTGRLQPQSQESQQDSVTGDCKHLSNASTASTQGTAEIPVHVGCCALVPAPARWIPSHWAGEEGLMQRRQR